MFRRLNKGAQTTAEYAILVALVVGAIVAMQVYVRRGIQGRVQEAVDYTGNLSQDITTGGTKFKLTGAQYEPYYLVSNASTSQEATETENLLTGGGIGRGSTGTTIVNRTVQSTNTDTE